MGAYHSPQYGHGPISRSLGLGNWRAQMTADHGEVRATAVIAEEAAADTLVLPVVTPN